MAAPKHSHGVVMDREDKAKDLAWLAHIAVIAGLPALLRLSPTFEAHVAERGTDSWDFFASVALAYWTLPLITTGLTDREYERFCRLVFEPSDGQESSSTVGAAASGFEKFQVGWHTDGPSALADCATFVERITQGAGDHEGCEDALVAVAFWTLRNTYGKNPGAEDEELLSVLGHWFGRAAATLY